MRYLPVNDHYLGAAMQFLRGRQTPQLPRRALAALLSALAVATFVTAGACDEQRPKCPAGERNAYAYFYYGGGVHPPELPAPNPAFVVIGHNFNANSDVSIRFYNYPSQDSWFERSAKSDGDGTVEWSAPIPPNGRELPMINQNDRKEHLDVLILLRDSAGCIATTRVDSYGFHKMFA